MSNPWKPAWPHLRPEDRIAETRAYFADNAPIYDEVDSQIYWSFSDALLWELLQQLVLSGVSDDGEFRFLDAGCGTARWSMKILEHLPQSTGVLVDLSPEMLQVARAKVERAGVAHRVTIVEDDLQRPKAFPTYQVDLVLCFHNVLSFVADPAAVLQSLVASLSPGGKLVLVLPNCYHAAYFSLRTGRWEEMQRIFSRGAVKFTNDVPEMLLFSPSLIKGALTACGVPEVAIYGFPVSIYPEVEESSIGHSSRFAETTLSDPDHRAMLLNMELLMCRNEEAASRGNNLLVIAERASVEGSRKGD